MTKLSHFLTSSRIPKWVNNVFIVAFTIGIIPIMAVFFLLGALVNRRK